MGFIFGCLGVVLHQHLLAHKALLFEFVGAFGSAFGLRISGASLLCCSHQLAVVSSFNHRRKACQLLVAFNLVTHLHFD